MFVIGGLLVVAGCPEESDDAMISTDESAGTTADAGGDLPGSDCALDIHDPNDSRSTAILIDANTSIQAMLCEAGDEADWWTFRLTETSYVGVETLFAKDGQDVALELWDGSTGAMIDRSEGGADIQAIHELLEPGTYDVRVERRAGNPTYTLRTYALSTATPPPPLEGGATRVFCPRFDLDEGYQDAASKSGIIEDFGVKDDPNRWEPKAMLVQVMDEQNNVLLGWTPLDASGCTPPVWTPSPSDQHFVLHYVLWSHFVRPQVPDTFVIIYDCEQLQPCALAEAYSPWVTAQGAMVKDTQFVHSAEPGQTFREELMVYWATAFAEWRLSMGVDAHIYARVLGAADQGGGQVLECPTGYCPNGTSCEMKGQIMVNHCRPKTRANTAVGGHPTLDIAAGASDGVKGSGAPEEKFTIAHELGHLQTIWVLGFSPMMAFVNYGWCLATSYSSSHAANTPEWQSAALVEGFADFYATAVFNELEDGAWFTAEPKVSIDIENDTMRFQKKCQATLDELIKSGKCTQPGDAKTCMDPGASNEIDWAGMLWDFAKVFGKSELPKVLRLLSDAAQLNWDPGSTTSTAYVNILQAANTRFPGNGDEFDAAAQANGTNR
jgi:hypothetical protein